MLLYIIRHAWAEERDDTQWPDDSQRPLTKEGEKRFGKVLKKLADIRFAPAIVATSPFVRCLQTAELISKRFHGRPNIVPLQALAPQSDITALVQWTAQQTDDEIAWIGHSPDVEHLLAHLIGQSEINIRFRKGTVAAVRFEKPIEIGRGELQWLATAKLLGE
ncbi:MAG TPA: histidine phosphatase family protein [Pirellulales bacterium]|jgi:phosphohistidine phosphatase